MCKPKILNREDEGGNDMTTLNPSTTTKEHNNAHSSTAVLDDYVKPSQSRTTQPPIPRGFYIQNCLFTFG